MSTYMASRKAPITRWRLTLTD